MRINFFKLLLLIVVLAMSSGDLLAQVNWTKYPGNPVLTGQPGTWYAYTTMNSVLYNADSSRYEMWFTAGAQISYPYTIGFAKSVDGITWEVYSTNPVLTPTPGSWDAYMVLAPYVLRENGQYKMWYTGCATSAILDRIGYATSPDGINWTKPLSNPVLEPGTEPWESAAVTYPCIMLYSNGYKMWYGGYSANLSVTGLGYATSPDGITWVKHSGNPVLQQGASGQWDHVVFGPRVLFIDNNYYMYYTGETVAYQSDKIGLATSPDGLVWTKYPSNPVLKPTVGQWDGSRTNLGSVLLDSDTLKMYYCGMPAGGSNMQIGLATSFFSPPLLPGTYTIGTGGNFATIQDAFDKLSTDGVAGNVTLELIDELYTAPTDSFGFKLNGPILGAGPNSRVTIKPAENKNVVIEGSCQFVLGFINSNYVTLDGVGLSGSTTLSVYNLDNIQYQFNDAVSFLDNSDHNTIKNCTLISDGFVKGSSGVSLFYINEAPDSNLIENNFVPRAGAGIYVAGKDQNTRAIGNIIRGNKVGSEVDSLISWGIQDQNTQNSIIEENIVQNINRQWNIGYYTPGINTAYSNGVIIRNNVVHNINSGDVWGSVGILVSGESWAMGSNNSVYNNMVYDIQCSSINSLSRLAGIQLFNQNNPKVYYNSVYLSGTEANKSGSAALYIYTNVTNADIKNNIFVNTRDESPYCASSIYAPNASQLNSDYNDLYYDDTNNNNCLVRIGSIKYNSLADWQVTTQDLHSYVEMPNFIDPYLHIDSTIATYLEARGTPIAGIEFDYDGESRNTLTPDIGADEMNGIVDVKDETTLPTEYALEQNYPNPFNPSTKISWQLPVGSQQTLKIYDVLGNEITTLIDEYKPAGRYEIEFNASSLPSGVYFYQLKAREFISTKKMILIR
jgi:predicted GH43/DUF377 family glycosyl hydrolase